MGLVDANSAGYVHGGTVMKLCDEVAGLAAVRHSRCRVVTAGMECVDQIARGEPPRTPTPMISVRVAADVP